MDREQAIEQLPETHAAAIRLRARGFDDNAIAKALHVQAEAVPTLLEIADQKLAALIAGEPAPQAGGDAGHGSRSSTQTDAKGERS
jgi:DNA-directed RNA polymerase specialized sigma24 family protein